MVAVPTSATKAAILETKSKIVLLLCSIIRNTEESALNSKDRANPDNWVNVNSLAVVPKFVGNLVAMYPLDVRFAKKLF